MGGGLRAAGPVYDGGVGVYGGYGGAGEGGRGDGGLAAARVHQGKACHRFRCWRSPAVPRGAKCNWPRSYVALGYMNARMQSQTLNAFQLRQCVPLIAIFDGPYSAGTGPLVPTFANYAGVHCSRQQWGHSSRSDVHRQKCKVGGVFLELFGTMIGPYSTQQLPISTYVRGGSRSAASRRRGSPPVVPHRPSTPQPLQQQGHAKGSTVGPMGFTSLRRCSYAKSP